MAAASRAAARPRGEWERGRGSAVPQAVLQNARDCARHRTVQFVASSAGARAAAVATVLASASLANTPSVPFAWEPAATVAVAAPGATAADRLELAMAVLGVPSPADAADPVRVLEAVAWATAAATLQTGLPRGVPAVTLPALPARPLPNRTVPPPLRGRAARGGARRAARGRSSGCGTVRSSSYPTTSAVTVAVVVGLVAFLGATRSLRLSSAGTIAAASATVTAVRRARRRTLSRTQAYMPPAGASSAHESTPLGGRLPLWHAWLLNLPWRELRRPPGFAQRRQSS